MAENTALALLSNQQQQSAQVFGQIMGAMNSVQQTAQQTAQFTFAVAAKEAQMREEARMNDARVHQINFQNEYYAAKHNAEMELMPLKMENERMQLETAKINQKNALLKQQYDVFNTTVDPFNKIVAARFSEIQDPAYAEEYMGIQAKWRGALANGAQLDVNAYKAEVDELNRKFEGAEAKPGYNARTSYYLGAMGSNSEKIRYDSKNPNFEPNLTALKSSVISGGQAALAKLADPNNEASKYLSEAQIQSLGVANIATTNLDSSIKSQQESVEMAHRAYMAAKVQTGDDPNAIKIAKELENGWQLEVSTLNQLRNDKRRVFEAALKGEEISTDLQNVTPSQVRESLLGRALREREENKKTQGESGTALPGAPTFGEPGFELKERQFARNPEVVRRWGQDVDGIDMSSFRGVDLSSNPQKVNQVRNKVLSNIDKKNLDQMKQLFDSRSKDRTFEGLFSAIGENLSTVEGAFPRSDVKGIGAYGYNQPGLDNPSLSIGKRTWSEFFNPFKAKGRTLQSGDDINEYIQDFEGTDAELELFLKDLYSSIITADIIQANR